MNGTPDISVIVPVFNDWEKAADLIGHLARQTLPAERFEALLVDNGSTAPPSPDTLPPPFRLLHCPTPGAYAARNHGAAAARGRWLAFTDADCLPAPDWLERLAEAFARPGAETRIHAGAIEMVSGSERPGAYEMFDLVKGIPQQRYVRRGYGATANLALAADVFRKLGGFDGERFSGGDAEFCRRAGAAGISTVYVADAKVGHRTRKTWGEISTKARRVKGGQVKAGSFKRRAAYVLRTLFPPLRGLRFFLTAKRQPLRHRLVASLVLFRVWLAEIGEMIRLGLGAPTERR